MDIMLAAILGVVVYLFGGLRVLREYERAVYFQAAADIAVRAR